MTEPAHQSTRDLVVDAAIVGGGLAGVATAADLARRGARVVLIEPKVWPRPAVGESLEFSAPRLLARLGIEVGCSDERHHLFPKESVEVTGSDGAFVLWPPPWFARPPIRCSRVTYHTDRAVLDHQVLRLAIEHGAEILHERVVRIDHDHNTIRALITDQGTCIKAAWFVDATGHSRRLIGRTLGLELDLLGPPRAAYWGRFCEPPANHATRLYFPDHLDSDLAWAWEIPLNPWDVSVGTVMSATRLAALRGRGLEPTEIFQAQVQRIPRLQRILADQPAVELHATAYTPYRHRRTIGPNWLLVGDASAMVDPLTSNGVTSALRHADQAARTISRTLDNRRLSRRERWMYHNTAPATVETLETAIESFIYHPAIRQRLGLRAAVTLYAATGVITNSLYARIGQTSALRSFGSASLLALSRSWARVGSTTARRMPHLRSTPKPNPPDTGEVISVSPELEAEPIEPAKLIEFIQRYFAAWNAHAPSAVAACATDDVVWDSPALPDRAVGRAAVAGLVAATALAFPDYEFTQPAPAAIAADQLTAYIPWRMTGTNTGSFDPPGYAATGKPIDLTGIDVWQFRNGLICRYRAVYDYSHVARQLGLAPTRGGKLERLAVNGQRLRTRMRDPALQQGRGPDNHS